MIPAIPQYSLSYVPFSLQAHIPSCGTHRLNLEFQWSLATPSQHKPGLQIDAPDAAHLEVQAIEHYRMETFYTPGEACAHTLPASLHTLPVSIHN